MAASAAADPTMTPPRSRRAAAVLLTTATLAGCGQGSDPAPEPAPARGRDSGLSADEASPGASTVGKPSAASPPHDGPPDKGQITEQPVAHEAIDNKPHADPMRKPATGVEQPQRVAAPGAFDLQRFVDAQDEVVHAPATTIYDVAVAELKAGRKREHWIWFVFPQIAGLAPNPSSMSSRYAIVSLAEARAYLADPVLGKRLADCARLVLAHPDLDAPTIFSTIDAAKLRSSMTLFSVAAGDAPNPFREVLAQKFGGHPDAATVKMLAEPGH